MFRKCCVVNCVSERKDVTFHCFPKTEIGLKQWLQCINCDILRRLSSAELRKNFVCQNHFEKRFLSSTNVRSRLTRGAYPTLFTPSEIANGRPENAVDLFNTDDINREHDYHQRKRHVDHTYCKPDITQKRAKTDMPTAPMPSTSIDVNVTSNSCDGNKTMEKPVQSGAAVHESPCKLTRYVAQRRRIICNQSKLTPKCARLYKEYKKSRRQLNFTQRANRALKFSKSKSFRFLTEKMNPLARKIFWMQITQMSKKARGRRFTDEQKIISMAILKQSPKCYNFLKKIFILPSKHTVNKMISQLNVETGINSQIFDSIKEEVSNWDSKKKMCSIMFDEVALEAGLYYDKHKDKIDGFVDLHEKSSDFADHALVFMIRGIADKWQQPLAYYFCKGATSSLILKNIIKKIISAVGNTGLLPIALICDQGTSFQSALKNLQEETRREQIVRGDKIDDVIVIDGHTLSVIFDPPHLIKGLRNNLVKTYYMKVEFANGAILWMCTKLTATMHRCD